MPPSSAGRRGSRSPTSAIPTASSPTSWPPRSRSAGPPAEGRPGPARDLRRQVGGRRLDRGAEPLACAGRDLGHAGRQGRVCREAGQPQRHRGAAHRAGGGEDRPDLPGRDAEPLQRRPGRGGRVHPRREARRREARAEHHLRPTRAASGPAASTRCPGRSITTSSWGRPPTCRSRARSSTTTGTGTGTPATASWGTTTSTSSTSAAG